MHDTVNKLYC